MASRTKQINKAVPLIGFAYTRYSSHSQREESTEQQIMEIEKFAADNNIELNEIFSDAALTGRNDRRPQFQRMMREAKKRRPDVIVAYKSNRIARNMLNALATENELDKIGVRVLYVKETFGDNAAGRFALRTMMNVNQFYSENMAEDIKRGLIDNAMNCKVTNGGLPLGYKKGEDGKYAIAEAKAAVVKEIFGRVSCG
ncbi:MAG: recombinase family protein, partial [Eubacteriales bacterium]|nr:recombinase family protein [Eubacteriales bacterium]